MPVTSYHTVDGLLLGETGPSGRRDYLPDAIGSVTATVDPTATVKNTYRYKPYGAFLVQGGPEADPKFLWTGETGSRNSGAPHAGQYNRARTYARETGRWTSVDPLWPDESAYGYVEGNPVNRIDPSGMQSQGLLVPLPSPGVIEPGSFKFACNTCAKEIHKNWWSVPAHYCNSNYAHCTACCTLSVLSGAKCAAIHQTAQNFFPSKDKSGKWKFADPAKKKQRMAACVTGVLTSEKIFNAKDGQSKCQQMCNKRYPTRYPIENGDCEGMITKGDVKGVGRPKYPTQFVHLPGCDAALIDKCRSGLR
ncbi:MAG: RHS repeat-associated core domain-containing protein [Alphaproteobacteria bacterium]|nr:MAG: RHS repeat-associated core domain-containing protein [Alphaproteobacteria bacterium]